MNIGISYFKYQTKNKKKKYLYNHDAICKCLIPQKFLVYDSLERNKSYIEIEQIKYKKWNVIEIFKYNGNI